MKYILGFVSAVMLSGSAFASGGAEHPKQMHRSFDGVLGRVDQQAAQRGFQVYKEVCSACHSLKRVAFRSLTGIGFSEAEVKSLAAGYTIADGPNDMGEMFDRPGLPSDKFPRPHANDNAARAANNGALPPDLSLIIKARHDGANYVYSILTGFGNNVPEHLSIPEGAHYNPYMDGGVIKMAPPLHEGGITYQDGTEASVDQQAKDVVNFLQWAAEPEMEERKFMGIHVMIFLSIMTVLFYLVKKRVWSELH